MKRKLSVLIFALFFFCLIGKGFAQIRVPGVESGDYFTYNLTSHWSSEDANATVPDEMKELSNLLWINFSVSGVRGANVTAIDTYHFVNGSERNFLVVQNVETGESLYMNAFQSVVGSNLKVDDLLHPRGNDSLRINQTVTRSYASGSRQTNVITVYETIEDENNSTIGNQNITYYFDKVTGMLVESIFQLEYTDSKENGSVITKLAETSNWKVSSSSPQGSIELLVPLPIIVVLASVIVLVLIIFIFYSRRKRHKKRVKRYAR